jgi:hypothetical protein
MNNKHEPDARRLVTDEADAMLPTLTTSDGVVARITNETHGDVLKVSDQAGRLILEHRASDGVTILHAPGDLEIRADAGSIRMVARDTFEVRAREANVAVDHATVRSKTITATADKVRQVVGVLETTAGRILERAKDVYRDAEGLSQTRAGRIKLVAEKTFHLLSEQVLVKAKDDVKIKGEKIYLA